MGNQSCVETGGNPHSMGVVVRNRSSKLLKLADDKCSCEKHRGFSADHGKFKDGFQPADSIEQGRHTACWMSGREASAVCPVGWIKYNVVGGGSLRIDFNSAGWSDTQNRAFVQVQVIDCPGLTVTTTQKSVEDAFPSHFRGTDHHRQFEVIISEKKDGPKSSAAGLPAENRVLSGLEVIPGMGLVTAAYHGIQGEPELAKQAAIKGGIGIAGMAVGGPIGGVLAGEMGGKALGNMVADISGPQDMLGNAVVRDLGTVPEFPTYANPANLKHALDQHTGKVVTGGPCAGVAIQRTWWLIRNRISKDSVWKRAKAPCIASDLCDWFRRDGFETEDLGKSWKKICRALQEGKVVNCIINNLHWVTLIGVQDGLVYVINYGGLYTVPEYEFQKQVCNVAIVAPTAAIAVFE